jgi:hypothetical protein
VRRPRARALDAALRELDDSYISLWTGLGRAERAAVVALADGLSPTSRGVAQDHGTARSSMQRAVERLEADGQLVLPPRDAARAARPALRGMAARR